MRDPFAGNTIPSGRIDAVAAGLLARYPLPNLPGTANNYRRVANEDVDQDQFDVRVDHRASGSDQIFARFSGFRDTTDPVTPLPDGSGNLTTGAIGRTETRSQGIVLSHVHTFGPRTVNDLRIGYTRRSVTRSGLLLDGTPSAVLGLPGIPTNAAFGDALPTFTMDGFQQLGSPANTNSDSTTDVTQIVSALSMQRGRHAFKAGVDFRLERLDIVQPPSPTGAFRFTSQGTDLPGTTGTGLSLASFLLGQVQNFTIDLQRSEFRERAKVFEAFVQDDWRPTSRLTVNAGVRYTLNFPSTEEDDQSAVFDLATQKLAYAGRDGEPRAARELHWDNFGPRLGLSYQLGAKSVVRAGYALVWIEQAGITTPFTQPVFPFLQNVSQASLDALRPAFVLSQGPTVAPIALTPDAGLGQSVFSVDRDLGSGYAQQWNVAYQRELGADFAVEIAYAGAKGTHIGVPDTNINQLTAEQLALGNVLLERVPNSCLGVVPPSSSLGGATVSRAQAMRPYPCFNTVSLYRNNVGNTNYNALQVKVEKRFSGGLSFLVSYTWSKLIDTASSVFDASILAGPVANFPVADSYNPTLERDVSTGDIPHNLVASFVWDLPWARDAGGVTGALLGGWQLAGIATFQSGIPIAVTQVTNFNAFAGFGTQRPNRVADTALPDADRTLARWFNTDAFRTAPQFTLGNSSRNPVRGPSYRNLDLALSKRVAIGGPRAVELEGGGVQRHEYAAAGRPERSAGRARVRFDHLGRRPACHPARRQAALLAARGGSPASHRGGRGARLARRDDREYRAYLREEQRRQPGCIARRMQPDFHHGLLDSVTRPLLVLGEERPFSSGAIRQTAAHIPRACTRRSRPAARSRPGASGEPRGLHRDRSRVALSAGLRRRTASPHGRWRCAHPHPPHRLRRGH